MPTSNANSTGNSDFFGFTGLTGSGIAYGAIWLGFWWPTPGYRNVNSATISDIGSVGYYWSASPHSTSQSFAYFFDFSSKGTFISDYYHRSNDFSVRCVQE